MEQVNKQNFIQKFISGVFGNSNANVQPATPQVNETSSSNLNTYNSLQGQVNQMRQDYSTPQQKAYPTPMNYPNNKPRGYCGNDPYIPGGPLNPTGGPIIPQNSIPDANPWVPNNFPNPFPFPSDTPPRPLTYQAADGTIRSTEFLPFDTDRDGMIDHNLDGKPVYELPGIGLNPTIQELETAIQNVLDTKLQQARLNFPQGIGGGTGFSSVDDGGNKPVNNFFASQNVNKNGLNSSDLYDRAQGLFSQATTMWRDNPKQSLQIRVQGEAMMSEAIKLSAVIHNKPSNQNNNNANLANKLVKNNNINAFNNEQTQETEKAAEDLMAQISHEYGGIRSASDFLFGVVPDSERVNIVNSAKNRLSQAYSQLMALPNLGKVPAIKAGASQLYLSEA